MKNPRRVLATTLALTSLGAGLTVPSAFAAPAEPGAAGIGDKVWPELGNGGYDVVDQKLAFTFNDKLTGYTASTTLSARATQGLSRFDLDLLGPDVTAVRVNGLRASWKSTPQGELVITPKRALRKDAPFTVKVDVRSNVPGVTDPKLVFPPGLIHYGDWIQAINQPSGARRMLAVSDHPAQKAPATITITAPARLNSIANGKLLKTTRTRTTATRVFREDRRIATELLQIGVGPFTVVHAPGPHGMDLRYAVPTAQLAAIKPQLKSFDQSIRFMEQRLGRFPGVRAGSYIAPVGGELETQGLTLMPASHMTKEGFEQNGVDGVVLHEVSHEWFGNSVSPKTWSDLWLNEGHAVFYEDVWTAARGRQSQSESMRHSYVERGNQLLANGPIAKPDPARWPGDSAPIRPYGDAAYEGGALTLFALQQKVGAKVFNRIERAWVRDHANSVASTVDFIATASKVAHQDLGPFLRSWLYGTKLPAMPGHPDWKAAA
ncbi:M1 family metallopeptidase [Kribbella koreensis]|uniref:Aminopeptidase N n=1 Tax=Kribbella koreensis TaxID=57909 RepID=A0ABN1RS04_9ACTN